MKMLRAFCATIALALLWALAAQAQTTVLDYPSSGSWFQNGGGIVQRLNDRVLIGGATLDDGDFPNIEQDWLTQFQIAAGLGNGSAIASDLVSLSPDNANGGATGTIGILGGAQSLHVVNAGSSTIGVFGIGVNNNASLATQAWGLYAEGHIANSTAGSAFGLESEVRNMGHENPIDPFTTLTTANLHISAPGNFGCGAGLSNAGQQPCSAGVIIHQNNTILDSGIVLTAGALNPRSGIFHAVDMPALDAFVWFSAANTVAATITATPAGQLYMTAAGGIVLNGVQGASCSGPPTPNFRTVGGLVVQC
jgi:hypothetical protein